MIQHDQDGFDSSSIPAAVEVVYGNNKRVYSLTMQCFGFFVHLIKVRLRRSSSPMNCDPTRDLIPMKRRGVIRGSVTSHGPLLRAARPYGYPLWFDEQACQT